MKIKLMLKTADTSRQEERNAMQQAVQRAMCRLVTSRITRRQSNKPLCRDALHQL
jgi:hypothetical protein